MLSKSPAVQRVISWILPFRLWLIIAVHIALFSLSYVLTFLLLGETLPETADSNLLLRSMVPLVVIRVAIFWYHDLYQGLWRYVSFEDLLNIIRALIISSLIFIVIGVAWQPLCIPNSFYVMDWILCIMLCGGIRFAVRNFREKILPGRSISELDSVLVVGPVNIGHQLVKDIIGDPHSHYNPVAIIDPTTEGKYGMTRVVDVPVWSVKQALFRQERLKNIVTIILCWPGASKKQLDAIVEELKSIQASFKTVPHIEDILADKVTISDIRDVEIDDLLERPPIKIELDQINLRLGGKTALVTGAGGSIGSELCRQIAGFQPNVLVIADRAENDLYELEVELKKTYPDVPVYATLSTINDFAGLRALIRSIKTDIVFHAAAYKHVPLMETVPIEAAYNNVLGTYNLARATMEAGVKRFVMISTDKAVNPTNVMGVSKRVAEMIVQSFNDQSRTKFMTVRFGNVLGSAGSVTPLFKKQIIEGGPVTVTHPEIERFFMTIPEAVQLVLQAGSMGDGGEIFVLEMGKPVKIVQLAEKLITLSGRRPYEDIEIKFTGLRPGEKMYEELFNQGEKHLPTDHNQIRIAKSQRLDFEFMNAQIEKIRELVINRDEEGLRKKFKELVPQYTPDIENGSKKVVELPLRTQKVQS